MNKKNLHEYLTESLKKKNPLYYTYVKEKKQINEELLQQELKKKIIPLMANSLTAVLKEEFSRKT